MDDPEASRRKRLLYQAQHRGFKEADLVIGGFAAANLASMTTKELNEFEALLQFPDPDLYAWLKGGEAAPSTVGEGPVFRQLRDFEPGSARRR